MTQFSMIQQGKEEDGISDDVGPYSAGEWAHMFQQIFQGGLFTSGVLSGVNNELDVSISGTTIQIANGGALVGGHYFETTAQTDIVAVSPSINPRIDVVCVLQNNTAIPVDTGVLTPNALLFPADLTDYRLSPSVPANSARLVILRGTEAVSPVVPTLDIDPDGIHMIPLKQYQISTGGVISNELDRRIFGVGSNAEGKLMERIAVGGEDEIHFADIPAGFSALRIEWFAVVSHHGTDKPAVVLEVNNVSAVTTIGTKLLEVVASGTSPTVPSTEYEAIFTPGITDLIDNEPAYGEFTIANLNNPSYNSTYKYQAFWRWEEDPATTVRSQRGLGTMFGFTPPIVDLGLTVVNSNDAKFLADSKFILYGIR